MSKLVTKLLNCYKELLAFSLYANNLIQANMNVPILDSINSGVPLSNDC